MSSTNPPLTKVAWALPGVGLDKVAKIKAEIVIPIPIKRSA